MNGYISPVIGGIITTAVLAAVTILAYHGTINGEAAVGIFATLIAGGGGGTLAVVAHNAGVKAAGGK